jgi:hypothetical protein
MSVRYLFLVAFLGGVFVLAGLLALDWAIWWLTPLEWLSRYQVFHLVAHFSIFAGVVILYRPQVHGGIRLALIVFSGGVILEVVQIAAGGFPLTTPLLLDSLLDIVVDVAGAAVCWFLLMQHHKRVRTSILMARLPRL